MDFNSIKYIQTPDGSIYKYRKEHEDWLKMTPWKFGEDRRFYAPGKEEGSQYISRILKKSDAFRMINEAFSNYTESWTFGGKTYSVFPNFDEVNAKLIPAHTFSHTYVDQQGVEAVISKADLYLAWFQGKLYWIKSNKLQVGNVRMYEFNGIDRMPGEQVRWSQLKHCKPVYCVTEGRFI